MIAFQQKILSDGIRLVTAPLESTEAVAILVLVGTGGRFEPSDKTGISHFLEHLFFKGTKKYPSAQKLSRELDKLGANHNAYTSEETTGFYIQSSANDFEKSLKLLAEMYLNPIFPEKEVAKEKNIIIEEANMRRDMPQIHVQVLAQKQIFPNSPLGEDLIGTPETLEAISRPDLVNYFDNSYNGASTIVAVCGNPKKFNWTKEIEEKFRSKPKGIKPECEMFVPSKTPEPVIFETRKVDQAHLVFSTQLFSKTDPRRYQAILLKTILGGGMSSRLFSEIREKRSLAYYVDTTASWYSDTGALVISTGVKTDKTNEAVAVILDQFRKLAQTGPKAEELKRAKSQLRGQIALSLEDSLEIASYLAEETQYEEKIRQPEEIISQIQKVTTDQIKNLTRDILVSAKMGLAVIAPQIDQAGLEKIIKSRS